MTKPADAFDDIPGTLLFNGERLRQGYQLNKFLSSLVERRQSEGVQGRPGWLPFEIPDDGRAARSGVEPRLAAHAGSRRKHFLHDKTRDL